MKSNKEKYTRSLTMTAEMVAARFRDDGSFDVVRTGFGADGLGVFASTTAADFMTEHNGEDSFLWHSSGWGLRYKTNKPDQARTAKLLWRGRAFVPEYLDLCKLRWLFVEVAKSVLPKEFGPAKEPLDARY